MSLVFFLIRPYSYKKVYIQKNRAKPIFSLYSTRRIMTKRVTSLRCPSPLHSANATQLLL